MSAPNGPGQESSSWIVNSQVPQTKATPAGTLEDGYMIAFTTGDGHPGSVFVPMSKYTPDKVKPIIQAQANIIDGVGSLTSDA